MIQEFIKCSFILFNLQFSFECKTWNAKLKQNLISGLRVADASIMPSHISGNTQVACYMIGEKAADLILEDVYNRNRK